MIHQQQIIVLLSNTNAHWSTINATCWAFLNIICGAPNVSVGQKVVVAQPGTTIYPVNEKPFKIKKAKIRGVESVGMICAED